MNIQKTLRRLTPAAWIAVAGTVAGVIAFGWFVAQMPFSTFDAGQMFGMAFGTAFTAALFFVPQILIVFLLAMSTRAARTVGIVLGGLAAIAGLAIGVMWLTGTQLEGQSSDRNELSLWLPLIVMGIIDGVAAAVALLALRHEQAPPLGRVTSA